MLLLSQRTGITSAHKLQSVMVHRVTCQATWCGCVPVLPADVLCLCAIHLQSRRWDGASRRAERIDVQLASSTITGDGGWASHWPNKLSTPLVMAQKEGRNAGAMDELLLQIRNVHELIRQGPDATGGRSLDPGLLCLSAVHARQLHAAPAHVQVQAGGRHPGVLKAAVSTSCVHTCSLNSAQAAVDLHARATAVIAAANANGNGLEGGRRIGQPFWCPVVLSVP